MAERENEGRPIVGRRGLLITAAVLAVCVLGGLYIHGNFDRTLYPIGLNLHECGRNGFGATFCGSELDEYRRRIESVKRTLTQAKESSEATERKSNEELEANERKSREEVSQHEAEQREHAVDQREEKAHALSAKIREERAIEAREPEGSIAYDEAKDELEYTLAEAQQLEVEAKSAG